MEPLVRTSEFEVMDNSLACERRLLFQVAPKDSRVVCLG